MSNQLSPFRSQGEGMRVVATALRWERDRARTMLLGATEKDFSTFHRSAEKLARAVRVYRRKYG